METERSDDRAGRRLRVQASAADQGRQDGVSNRAAGGGRRRQRRNASPLQRQVVKREQQRTRRLDMTTGPSLRSLSPALVWRAISVSYACPASYRLVPDWHRRRTGHVGRCCQLPSIALRLELAVSSVGRRSFGRAALAHGVAAAIDLDLSVGPASESDPPTAINGVRRPAHVSTFPSQGSPSAAENGPPAERDGRDDARVRPPVDRLAARERLGRRRRQFAPSWRALDLSLAARSQAEARTGLYVTALLPQARSGGPQGRGRPIAGRKCATEG